MDECSNLIYDETGGQLDMGQSDSKGARKRSNTPSGKGASMSFGFRKKSGKNGANNATMASNLADKNGNGGSTEELYTGNEVTSGRSTPLARPRKESSGQPLRTNRFGFRQATIPKTAKVADINLSVEQALTANLENKNNNISDKNYAKNAFNPPLGLIPTQVGPNGVANIGNVLPKQSKQQTVILTYTAKQYPVVPNSGLRSKSPAVPNRVTNYQNYSNQRSASASRAYSNVSYNSDQQTGGSRFGNVGKYTFQTNQLPKPQYPAMKVLDTKSAKQVANNSRKVYGSSSDGSSKEGSMTEDSGVSGLGDGCGDPADPNWSPRSSRRQHRRPRTLEMIMQGDHNFQLRELQVNDLDIMVNDFSDEAIITDNDVIPLPKLPSTFDQKEDSSAYFQVPDRFNLNTSKLLGSTSDSQPSNRTSYSSTLERYRINRDSNRSSNDVDDLFKYKGEEKASRDRTQHEKSEKQDFCKIINSQGNSPLTRDSSKESSPSTKSDDTHPSIVSSTSSYPLNSWINQNAGESMAAQEDISVALSLSLSCDEDKDKDKKITPPSNFVPTTIDIVNKDLTDSYGSLSTHPMMMKSLSLSQHHGLQSMLMSNSMTSSAMTFSADSSALSGNDLRNLDLLMGDSRLRMATLTSSNHSLIEDETSPADSLISSSTDSNNDMPIMEKDITMSSSAYHTADNKTLEASKDEDETCMEDNLKDKDSNEKSPSKKSPRSPDTPTNASNSLSLSEGRDFLIDDEIADQPALIFEANSTAEPPTSSLQLLNLNTTDNTPTIQDTNQHANKMKVTASPRMRPKRSPSLDTLSPCDSIASDDLIMDMELNNSITSLNSVDEYIDRLDGSIRSGLNSLEDIQLREELLKLSVKKFSSQILNSDMLGGNTPVKINSNSTSNSSLPNVGTNLPVRTGRLLSRSRAGTPDSPLVGDGSRTSTTAGSAGSGVHPDDAMRLERATHGHMMNDIVTIKTMLLKLKRVLQEPDEEHNLMRTETLNPLDAQRDICPLKNGPSLRLGEVGEASPPPPPPAPQEEVADLRRQLVFLQSQLEDRERLVKLLQQQMSKYSENHPGLENGKTNSSSSSEDTCNVATQTERLRPVNQGSNILQSLTTDSHVPGSIVSWNEQIRSRSILSPCNLRQSSSSPTSPVKRQAYSLVSSPVSSDCESNIYKKVNGVKNGHSNHQTKDSSPTRSIKTNCRVGTKYLQAIANKQNGTKPFNYNFSNKSLHIRSKSIENFSKHNIYTSEIDYGESKCLNGNSDSKENLIKKHHKSYTNLFNGVSNGENGNYKINGHCKKNGYTNGNATDTDDNSDSGYKSLPPSINLSNSKISGIPRRTQIMELKPLKQAQMNKC